jgi:hypothetical protein
MIVGRHVLAMSLLAALVSPLSLAGTARAGDAANAPRYQLGPGRSLGAGPAKENSGIVKSRQWPDLFWMQNDSGDEPRIYPVRRDGTVYNGSRDAESPGVLIGGAINVDWEDIAVDSSGRVIVADMGNNGNDRRDLVLYVVPEPSPDADRTAFVRKVFFRYPQQHAFPAPADDFNYDAEALFMLGDAAFVCTKHRSDTTTRVFRIDLSSDRDVQDAELVDSFDVRGQVTGADATPDGRQVVLLTYDALWLFDVDDPNRPLSGAVRWLPYAGAEDAEAVCFADDQTLLVAEEATARLFEAPISAFRPAPAAPSEAPAK